MKKLISSVLSVCILLSMVLGTTVAYANEPELTSESTTFKGTGLADETSLLKEVGLMKDDISVEPEVDEELSEEDLKQKFSQLTEKNIENVTREFDGDTNTNYQELYDEYSNIDLENREIEFDETKASNYAISYYSGTSIPTYTSVTGWSLRDSYTSDGYVFYSYYYNVDDHFDYIEYLMDYYGWSYYDDTEASDGSYATIYLVKGYDMIAIIANFRYNETVIMFEAPTTVSPTSVSLDISSRTMIVGNQYTLEATVYPSNASNKSVTWSSSNSSVASVSSSGVVTAKAAGSATITAKTSNGKTATCAITVKNLVLAYYPNTKIPTFTCITGKSVYQSMEDDGTTMYFYVLDIESHTDYEAYLVNKDGWTILDEELASDNSYFSALYGKGDVTMLVMANFESGLTGIAFDTPVTTVPVTGVSLNKTSATMTVGNTMTLTATVSPSTATNKNVTWTSSNTSVATVSTSGVVTAKAAGSATITVKTADGNKTATCSITVTNPTVAVTGISLNKTSTTLFVGDTETLSATIAPEDATNKSVTWSSSNTSVATVSNNGVVTAKAEGTTTITAKTADGNKTATCTVTVKPITPTIEVESAFGQAGNVVDVTIKMAHNPGVALVGFDVNYNSDVMTLKSATLGDIFTGELECNINAVPFVFNVYSGSSNKTTSGDLVTLQFEIKESCPVGDYDITLSNIETLNIDENSVNFDCTNGKITVRDSIPGDVNGDGKVTRNDLLRLAKHFSGFTVEIDEVAADVTADGKVTRNDLLRLAKYFSGFDVALGK